MGKQRTLKWATHKEDRDRAHMITMVGPCGEQRKVMSIGGDRKDARERLANMYPEFAIKTHRVVKVDNS